MFPSRTETKERCPRCGNGPVFEVVKDEWVTVDHIPSRPGLGVYVVGVRTMDCSDCDESFSGVMCDPREKARGMDYYLWQVWRVTGQRSDFVEKHDELREQWEADLHERGLSPDGVVAEPH